MQIEYFNDTAFANDPMYGITYTGEGYQIRLGHPDRDMWFTAYFALSHYHDALQAAQHTRDKVLRSKAFRNRDMGTGGSINTTGFFGVSCDCRWRIQERDNRIDTSRKFRFFVRTNEFLHNGIQRYTCLSGVRKGPWKTYLEAVRLRHEIIGKRVTNKLIAQRYDQVFIPNYRERLEALELDWRRPE